MDRKLVTAFLCVITLVLNWAGVVRAADAELDADTKARIALAEQGPATIDVSKYPQAIQDNYNDVFSQKCTQCHRLSRPINSAYCIPAEWERYVKRMMHKPGSNINSVDAKKIFDFLVYDSSVRKKALLDEKLSKVTPEEKSAAEKKIKEIHDKYDQ